MIKAMTSIAARYRALSANAQGALWMLASALVFTVMTALIKFLGNSYAPAVQTFYRQAAGVLVLAPIIARDPAALRVRRPGVFLFRALCLTLGVTLAFYAYQELPLAEANALSFTRTLWMVPLAVIVLREPVGPWRLGAILVGFVGVVIMLQPSGAFHLSLPAGAALVSGLLFAAGITGMKLLTRDHSLTAITAWGAILGLVLSLPLALLDWRWPSLPDFGLLTLMGAFGLGAQVCYIRGMTLGDAAAMAPIDYTRLVIAALVGFALFGETPTAATIVGALVVIAATLAITLREARLNKPPAPAPE
jgi:drug/metabolite transporter (DMT)-like permease